MAFPQVLGRQSSSRATDATTHDVVLTAFSAGDLVVIVYSTDGSGASNWTTTSTNDGAGGPFTWQKPMADENNSGGCNGGVRWRIMSGSETSPQEFTTSASETFTSRAYVIDDGTYNATTPVEVASSEQNTQDPDPPSLTPSWGALDTLWIAAYASDLHATSTGPASYSNFVNVVSLGSGSISCSIGVADRELNATSENPGIFTKAAENHINMTIAIQPFGAAAATTVPLVTARQAA